VIVLSGRSLSSQSVRELDAAAVIILRAFGGVWQKNGSGPFMERPQQRKTALWREKLRRVFCGEVAAL
jgi:hypothetical protein